MDLLNTTTATSTNISSISSALVPGVVLSVCFLLGVPGNLAVIVFLVRTQQQLSSLSRSLMLNLAVSDLLCLLTLPVWVYALLHTWNLGPVACKVVTYLLTCSVYCSLLTVMLLSIQRYVYVAYTQRWTRPGEAAERGLLVLVWEAVVVLSVPSLIIRRVIEGEPRTACLPVFSSDAQQVTVLLLESLTVFVLPFSIMISAYLCLHRRVSQTPLFNNPRMTRLVTSIVVIFFILWTPYHIINTLAAGSILLGNKSLLEFCIHSWPIIKALTFVNSCLDPLLYGFATRNSCTACSNV